MSSHERTWLLVIIRWTFFLTKSSSLSVAYSRYFKIMNKLSSSTPSSGLNSKVSKASFRVLSILLSKHYMVFRLSLIEAFFYKNEPFPVGTDNWFKSIVEFSLVLFFLSFSLCSYSTNIVLGCSFSLPISYFETSVWLCLLISGRYVNRLSTFSLATSLIFLILLTPSS